MDGRRGPLRRPVPHHGPGWLDRFLAADAVVHLLLMLMLAGCCVLAPLAGFIAALGLLSCRTYEARQNAQFLFVAAVGHGLIVAYLAVQTLLY